jgi:GrpB-like predicted nucleotidyltransferase (UPF0157 family)
MPETIIGSYPFHAPVCTEYDPRAPAVARRIAHWVRVHLPTVAVEHIGSTAVPGCAGKGVVDLMVVYPDGQLETVKETLFALGFQRQTVGFLLPEARPMRVGTVEHEGSLFRLHVHVLAASSPEVGQLRAFRDRLRADPQLVTTYVARKKEILAAGITDPAVYTRMKSLFFQEVQGSPPAVSPTVVATSSASQSTPCV